MRTPGWQGSLENMEAGWRARYKHGCTSTYVVWCKMRQRCENPKNDRYADYGGRGIEVCERWQQFENFRQDMGERPTGTSLDRYPNQNGNYEPGNCRWATRTQQQNNMRSNHLIEWRGRTMTLTEAAREVGIHPGTLLARIERGWSMTRAMTEPSTRKRRRLRVGGSVII